ncbi:hypothetical protein B9Q13_03905 [Candidatus Marsarchaeota G2 archaeon ECH_B_SAG-G16]|jgi:ATP-binding cassette subfamily B protein|uniref:ABC transporter ATP-binding protein n=3 Tax=Candidatus Marsarchaeota TaxID=1978152 RepID=A0A2R6A8U0_9ARCH|nr:MAG: hypothetical protein B9Q01_06865 [Candidatus Marsarchaeota G1 archaeon OSP_D]PSN87511.1 MAG: hypothetical protein B9Q00_08615 [Candidatus Marsarchaeota G1 archaeon OSP_C]PSO04678.1 MAG: hypothetical protein B9Q13_03905 [Candidatus Marsarchaeota G2 archaeon ECH_B_SAG-G16]
MVYEDEQKQIKDFEKVRRLASHMLKYKKEVVLIALSILTSTAVTMLAPYVLGLSVNSITQEKFTQTAEFGALYGALYVLNYFAENRRSYLLPVVSQKVIKDLRDECFRTLQIVPIDYYSKREAGRIMSYVLNDAEALSDFLTFQLPQVLAGFIGVIGSIAIMLYLNLSLTAISISVIPALALFSFALQGKIRKNFLETRRTIAVVTARLQEAISGIRVIKAFSKEREISKRFDEANVNNMLANLKANRLTSSFNSVILVIEAFGIALVLFYGSKEVLSGEITIGLLVSFLAYVQGFFNPIIQLSQFYNSYQTAMVGLERIYRLIDSAPKSDEKPAIPAPELKGEIEFQDVHFSYDGKTEVLKGVSFVIPSGSKVAIVGPTGAGKSTLVNILLKFYKPTSGRVLVDGYDIFSLETKSYRSQLAVVLQEPFLFSTTVFDNIRFGSKTTKEEVLKTLKELELEDIFSSLPQGIDTQLTERGGNLSEGQKQVVSFLRAIVRKPKIIILDEATSQLDPFTESRLQKALFKALSGRTSIIIAHRLSTVKTCDFVIYIDNGKVVEMGPPSKLVNSDGRFAKMLKAFSDSSAF